MKTKLISLAMGALLVGCTAASATGNYTITAEIPTDDFEGLTAYLVNFDTGEKIDSTMIDNGKAVFKGSIATPALARIIVDGNRMGSLVVENAEISTQHTPQGTVVSGSPLNDLNTSIQKRIRGFEQQFRALPNDSTAEAAAQAILNAYDAYTDSVFKANTDNPVGYSLFLDKAYRMNLAELKTALEKYPVLKGYQRVNKLITAAVNKEATSPGKKFVDFTITNDSISQSLSDYVGKGKPVLVDFWASWCGPCIRETAVIKDLLKEYGPQGLEVLGVAVWDEPDNTSRAIAQHQLPWSQIINAQTVPTDLYGISGIPTILIIGPDGTILSRDKQDEELRADVKAVMEGTLSAATSPPKPQKAPTASRPQNKRKIKTLSFQGKHPADNRRRYHDRYCRADSVGQPVEPVGSAPHMHCPLEQFDSSAEGNRGQSYHSSQMPSYKRRVSPEIAALYAPAATVQLAHEREAAEHTGMHYLVEPGNMWHRRIAKRRAGKRKP